MQNRPLEPPRTLLEARSLLGTLICTFLAPFGTPKGPQNRSNIDHFLDMFFNDFWGPLFDALGLHLASQNTSKMTPKRVPKTHLIEKWKSSSRCSQSSIQRGVGVLKIMIFLAFLVPFLRCRFETSFLSILAPFGDPLGTPWAPKKHSKKHLRKRPPKRAQKKPVLAREREARWFQGAWLQACS